MALDLVGHSPPVPTYLQFKVTLRRIDPAIWRRFLLRSDTSFAFLHEATAAVGSLMLGNALP